MLENGLPLNQALFLSREKTAVWICALSSSTSKVYTTEEHSLDTLRNVLRTESCRGFSLHISVAQQDLDMLQGQYSLKIACLESIGNRSENVDLLSYGQFETIVDDAAYDEIGDALMSRDIPRHAGWLPK